MLGAFLYKFSGLFLLCHLAQALDTFFCRWMTMKETTNFLCNSATVSGKGVTNEEVGGSMTR